MVSRLAIALMVALSAAALPAQQGSGEAAGGAQDRPGLGETARGGRGAQPLMMDPASPAARLMLASPEQRRRALQKLPPQRRQQIRRQLNWFDSLPKAQQQMQIRRLERFASLGQERQMTVRRQMRALNQMPQPRRQAIRRTIQALQDMPEGQRANRLNSEAFKTRFSPREQQIIIDLCDAWLPPR